MFSEALLEDIRQEDRELIVLGFCNPMFMQVAKLHAEHFQRLIMSLDPDDEEKSFKLDYKVAKANLNSWQALLNFAAKYAPNETEWGREFEKLLTQIGGQKS